MPNSVISFDRQFVDTKGDRWLLLKSADGGDQIAIAWSQFCSIATSETTEARIPARTVHIARLYASDRLARKAPSTVNNDLSALRRFLQWLFNSKSHPVESLQWAAIREYHFRGFLDQILQTANRGNDFHRVRLFFKWGVRQALPDFEPQLLRKLKTIHAPGNLSGQHVLSQNATKGPLYREEIDLIVRALKKGEGTAQDRAIVMLFLELGLNANQAARLRNEDLISFDGDINGGAHSEYQLCIPRNKKRRPFRETKQRVISGDLATLLKSLQR